MTVDHLRKEWRDPGAARISAELWKRRKSLYTFLVVPGVAWHNNEAETQIRQGGVDPEDQRGREVVDGGTGSRATALYLTGCAGNEAGRL